MSELSAECTEFHCRLMKCALEVDDSRAYWGHWAARKESATARQAFAEYWFGARSLARIEMLLAHLAWRFDKYPNAIQVLSQWNDMDPDTRRVLCHWHLQLSDPLYRSFTGDFLVARRNSGRSDVSRDVVVVWVAEQAPGRWTVPTQLKFATKLLYAAHSAGLVGSSRDPRPLCFPRVDDHALSYLIYLLREVRFVGTLLENPYLASVGLCDNELDRRLRGLSALRFQRQGDLVDFGWQFPNLLQWAEATMLQEGAASKGMMR